MPRFINADSRIVEIKKIYCDGCDNYGGAKCRACWVDDAICLIEDATTADVAPVRHGRWLLITAGYRNFGWCCSECGRSVSINCDEELRQSMLEKEYPFCHCGAKMDGGINK